MIVLELGQVGGIAIRDELRGVMGGLLGGLGRPTLPGGALQGAPLTWHCCCSFLVGRPTM